MSDRINYREIMRILWKNFSFMKGRRALYTVGGILGLGSLAISFLIPYLYEQFARLAGAGAGYAELLRQTSLPFILLLALVPLVCGGSYWQKAAGNFAVSNMQKAVFSHTMRMPVSSLEVDRADKVMRATSNVYSAATLFSGYTMTIVFKFIIYFFGAFTILLFVNLRFAFIGVALCALMLWAITGLTVRLRALERRALKEDASLAARLLDLVNNLPMVKLLSIESLLAKKFSEAGEEAYQCRLAYKVMRGASDGILDFMAYGAQAFAILAGVCFLGMGGSNFPSLIYIASMFSLMITGIRELGSAILFIQNTIVSTERVCELLDEPCETDHASTASPDRSLDCALELRGVSFSYEPGRPVLHNVSLRIMKGQMTAFVGGSGCGKTTILKLLEGFYRPDSGEITLFGAPAAQMSNQDVRRCFSYIPQDAQLFDGTVQDNILLDGAAAENEEVRQVMQAAALEAVDPNTLVGERGSKLSGGQAQRIAIARALYRDAPIYLLDEATAALDSETEREIQSTIQSALKGKTLVCVAHRLSTIRHADKIVYMEKGRVLEVGTHEELMRKKGGYYTLCCGKQLVGE